MFTAGFLNFLVILGLSWTGLGVIVLLALLYRDWKRGELW